jgi:hypothetical protein
VRRTLDEGPRIVMRSGAELVVVVAAADEYRRSQQARPDFKEFLMSGSDFEQLDLTRSSELPREIDFGDA